MANIHEISDRLHQDPDYGPALTRFRRALADHVTMKSDEDKTAKPFPSFKHLHRSLEEAGIEVGYHHIQNGHMEHRVPQLAPALLNRIADHVEDKAKTYKPQRLETLSLSVSFDAAEQGDISREELEAVARAAIEAHLARKAQSRTGQDGATSAAAPKPQA